MDKMERKIYLDKIDAQYLELLQKVEKMKSKYIVIDMGMIVAIIFPECLDHDKVADRFVPRNKVMSAGFLYIDGDDVQLYGKSYTLKIDSNQDHVEFVKQALGMV